MFDIFRKSAKKVQVPLKYDKNNGILHEDLCTFLSYVAQFFLEKEMFHTNVAHKIKTHFMFNISCYEILIVYKIMWGKYDTARQATNDRITQRTHFAFWITTPIKTHLEYIILFFLR